LSKRPLEHPLKYDMLRGMASIVVLVAHVVETQLQRLLGSDNTAVLLGENLAPHAVLVFFLLSGYLITQSIVANIDRNGRFAVGEYLAARITRIYPPLVGAILIALAVWYVVHGLNLPGSRPYGLPGDLFLVRAAYTVTVWDIPRALLMQNGLLQADGPLWSLYVEFHLYLIAMFIAVALCARRGWIWRGVALLLIGFWAWLDLSFLFYASIWALGAAAMLCRPRLIMSGSVNRLKLISFPLAACLVGVAVAAPQLLDIANPNPWIAYGVQWLCCLVYADFMFLRDGFAAKPPRWVVRTGHFSYSLYVIHFPLLLLVLSLTEDWVGKSLARALVVALPAAVAVTMAAAWFAKFFEDQRRFKPSIRTALNLIFPAPATGTQGRQP
jgi:peptidoglycan/LPS O-acetylase OafA/YrhL